MTASTIATIKPKDPVKFTSLEGELHGHVLDLQRSIENGQMHAIVEIEHELPGIVHSVPLDQVTRRTA